MAKSRIFVFNGSITLPTGFAMDCQTMRINETQNSEDVTSYQGTVYGIDFGSGTTKQTVDVTGYPYKGITASNLGFGSMNGSTGALGAAATFLLDTGISSTGNYLVSSVGMDHSRLVAGAKSNLSLRPSGDITIAWATS